MEIYYVYRKNALEYLVIYSILCENAINLRKQILFAKDIDKQMIEDVHVVEWYHIS